MAYQQKDNSGALFRNEKKTREAQPDFGGNLKVDGKEYWLSGWQRDGAKGAWISIALKPKTDGQKAEQNKNQDAPENIGSGDGDRAPIDSDDAHGLPF